MKLDWRRLTAVFFMVACLIVSGVVVTDSDFKASDVSKSEETSEADNEIEHTDKGQNEEASKEETLKEEPSKDGDIIITPIVPGFEENESSEESDDVIEKPSEEEGEEEQELEVVEEELSLYAAEYGDNLGGIKVTGGDENVDFEWAQETGQNGLTIKGTSNKSLTISADSGVTTGTYIIVESGYGGTLTLKNLDFTGKSTGWINAKSSIDIVITGTVKLVGTQTKPAMELEAGGTLSGQGNLSLTNNATHATYNTNNALSFGGALDVATNVKATSNDSYAIKGSTLTVNSGGNVNAVSEANICAVFLDTLSLVSGSNLTVNGKGTGDAATGTSYLGAITIKSGISCQSGSNLSSEGTYALVSYVDFTPPDSMTITVLRSGTSREYSENIYTYRSADHGNYYFLNYNYSNFLPAIKAVLGDPTTGGGDTEQKPKAVIATIGDYSFDGTNRPTITITAGTETLVLGNDYTVEYIGNNTVGQATVRVTYVDPDRFASDSETEKTYRIVKGTHPPITVSLDSWKVGETAKTPKVTGDLTGDTKNFEYKKQSESIYKSFDTPPTEVGNYDIRVTIPETTNYKEIQATNTFSISSGTPVYTAPTLKSSPLTYSGSLQDLVNYGSSDHGDFKYKVNSASGVATAQGKDVGSYTVSYWIQGKDGYGNVGSEDEPKILGTVSITAKPLNNNALTITSSDFTYSGTQNIPTFEVKDGSILLQEGEDKDYTKEITGGLNAGSGTVKVTFRGNYNGTATKAFNVNPLALTNDNVTFSSILAQDYSNGNQIKPTFTVSVNTPSLSLSDSDFESVTYTNNTGAGPATITVKLKGNYSGTITTGFTINKVAASISTHPTAVANLEDKGTDQILIRAGSATGGTLYYNLNDVDTTDSSWSTELPKGTAPGDYTVYYYVKGDANHTDTAVQHVVVNISKVRAKITKAPTAITGIEYDGNEHELISEGTATGGIIKYSLDYSSQNPGGATWIETLPKGQNAGTYNVYYYVDGDATHDDSAVAGPITVTINASNATFTSQPQANDLTYTGTDQELVSAGTSSDGDVVYSLSRTGAFSLTVPRGLDAKTYTVYAKVSGNSSHVDSDIVSISVTIKKKPITIEWTDTQIDYDGQPHVPKATAQDTIGTVPVTVTGQKTDAGTYTATATITDKNHEIIGGNTTEFTINKVNPTVGTAPSVKIGLTYTGSAQALVEKGEVAGGAIQYSVDYNSKGYGSWSTNTPMGTNIGSYSIKYKVVGDKNHKDIGETEIGTVQIEGIDISIGSIVLGNQHIYTGETPEVTVKVNNKTLKENVDYTLAITAGSSAGKKTVTATGIGNYNGTLVKTDAYSVVDMDVSVTDNSSLQNIAIVTPKDKIIDMLLSSGQISEADKANILDGVLKLDVVLTVADDGSVDDDEKLRIEKALNVGGSDGEIAKYYDITLNATVGSDVRPVSNLGGKEIAISFDLPSDLKNADTSKVRTHWVIRDHNSNSTRLKTNLNNNKVTFYTGLFSTYALGYIDTIKTDKDSKESRGLVSGITDTFSTFVKSPSTGFEKMAKDPLWGWPIYATLLMVILLTLGGVLIIRKIKQ